MSRSTRRTAPSATSPATCHRVAAPSAAPLAELAGYQSRLNAMTSGQGSYTLALSHYEAVPPQTQQQLASQFQVRDDD